MHVAKFFQQKNLEENLILIEPKRLSTNTSIPFENQCTPFWDKGKESRSKRKHTKKNSILLKGRRTRFSKLIISRAYPRHFFFLLIFFYFFFFQTGCEWCSQLAYICYSGIVSTFSMFMPSLIPSSQRPKLRALFWDPHNLEKQRNDVNPAMCKLLYRRIRG